MEQIVLSPVKNTKNSQRIREMCISITNAFFSILMHISVIQFRYMYRNNCILNTDI